MIDNLSWVVAYPEILLLIMACVIALVDLGVKTPLRTVTHFLSMLTLGGLAVLLASYVVKPGKPFMVSAAWWCPIQWATGSSVLRAFP